MRRVFVVFALLAMMAGLDALKTQSVGASDPLTLAAIGFVVLAAFAVAELGARLSLPKVTGYILSGIALGPFVIDILSRAVVQELRMFSTLALGLIALSAGLELDLRGLASLARTLMTTIGIKIVGGFVLVGGTLTLIILGTSLVGDKTPAEALCLGLVFGALSLGTSPSVALAVTTESQSKGRLTDLVLGAAVVKDVIVVVCLAIALATAKAVLGGGQPGSDVLIHLGRELGLSILTGAIVGFALIAYIRWIRHEMLLVVVVAVLVVAEIASTFHLELLLVFIVAGATVRNASPYEHTLLDPLQKISLPIFIVFFTNAGAGVDLESTWNLLPVALALCIVRAFVYFFASRWGSRIGRESPAVQRLAWLAYLPQAGVTLGLVTLAGLAVPSIAKEILTLGMAVVAVNLISGPVTLRVALRAAGEIPASPGDAVDEEPSIDEASPDRLPATLTAHVDGLRAVLERSWASWRTEHLEPELRAWREALRSDQPHLPSGTSVTTEVAKRLDRVPALDSEARRQALLGTLIEHLGAIEVLPVTVELPLEDHHRKVNVRDTFAAQVAKRLAAVGALLSARSKRRIRPIPVRIAARATFEPAMATLAEETLHDVQKFEVLCLECMQRVAQGTYTWEEGQRELDGLVEQTRIRVAENHQATLARGTQTFKRWLANLGAPAQWRRRIRYSRVAPTIRDALKHLNADSQDWTERRSAAIRTLRFVTEVEHAEIRLATDLRRDVTDILDEAFAGLGRLVEEEQARIDALPRAADVQNEEEWQRLGARVRAILPKPNQRELRALTMRVRRATSASAPLSGALSFVADGEATIRIIPSLHDMARAARPARVEPLTADVRELKEVQISGQLLPQIERILDDVSQALAAIREGMREAASLIEFGFEAADAGRTGHQSDAAAKFDESIDRALSMLSTLRVGACESWAKHRDALREDVGHMSTRLFQALAAEGGSAMERAVGHHPLEHASEWVRHGFSLIQDRLQRVVELLRAGETGQNADDLALRYQLRTGGKRVDAQAIRAYLEEQLKVRTTSIEGLYASLFTSDPLRDPRLFIAHRDALNSIIKAARAWQTDTRAGNGALVLGGSGSGKSSTLGIAQLKLGARRVLLIRRRGSEDLSMLDALSRALGCESKLEAVLKALRSQRSVVVLDDMHYWMTPDLDGTKELMRFTELMTVTQESTFFLASISTEAFELWHRVVPIDQSFSSIVRLRPIVAETLDAVIAARHELSGLDLEFPTTLGARFAERVLGRPIRTSFVRTLATASGGNLRRALALWLAHASTEDERVHLRPVQAYGWALPFVHQLGAQAMAVLSILIRHGAQTEEALGRFVGANTDDMVRLARFLVASGLVVRDQDTAHVAVTARFVDDLVRALAERGILAGTLP